MNEQSPSVEAAAEELHRPYDAEGAILDDISDGEAGKRWISDTFIGDMNLAQAAFPPYSRPSVFCLRPPRRSGGRRRRVPALGEGGLVSGGLDRHLSDLDYRIRVAHGRVETSYALDQHEARKEAAFRRLEALLQERDALRRAWSSADRDDPQEGGEHPGPRTRALFGPGVEEIPIYDPEALIW